MTDPDMPSPMARAKFDEIRNRAPRIAEIIRRRHAADPEGHPYMAVPAEMATFSPILGNYDRFSQPYDARDAADELNRKGWVVVKVAPDGRNLGRTDW